MAEPRLKLTNCFLLKTDIIQNNREGMDFSKEVGAAIKAVNKESALEPPGHLVESVKH